MNKPIGIAVAAFAISLSAGIGARAAPSGPGGCGPTGVDNAHPAQAEQTGANNARLTSEQTGVDNGALRRTAQNRTGNTPHQVASATTRCP